MAKRQHFIPMGRHKPVRSSWASVDSAYHRAYVPQEKPEYHCFVTGQFPAMQDQWRKSQEEKARQDAASIMATLI